MYNHDVDILGIQLLPHVLRQSRIIAFVRVLLSQLRLLYSQFIATITDIDNITKYNAQVIYLAKAIADKLLISVEIHDNVDRYNQTYIYTIADDSNDYQYIFSIDDINSQYYYEIYIYTNIDYLYEADYIVVIDPYTQENEILTKSIIDLYNPAGKRYKII